MCWPYDICSVVNMCQVFLYKCSLLNTYLLDTSVIVSGTRYAYAGGSLTAAEFSTFLGGL